MFTSFLAVPIAITLFNPFPFPSFKAFPFPTNSPAPTSTPIPTSTPQPSNSATPKPTPVSTAVEIEDVDPNSANFMDEFIVYGTNFGPTPGSVNFRYYNQSFVSAGSPIISWTNSEIHAKVPALKKGSYRIQVVTADSKKSNEERFSINNGQPIVNSTSVRLLNGAYELTFEGSEFGFMRGEVNIYVGSNLAGKGIIKYWSSSRVRFALPTLPKQEYGFQIQTSDGRQSSLKYFNVGN